MNKLDEFFNESRNAEEYSKKYLSYLSELFSALNTAKISEMIEQFVDARNKSKKIIFIGNGGSAATASHFANDISIGTRKENKPYRAISLTDNSVILTAIANDDGYDEVFIQQLKVVMEEGDILVCISASGNSKNLLKAVDYAKEKKNKVIGLTGFDGGALAKVSDINVHIETLKGEYGPVEDIHMILDHLISSYLYRIS